MYLKKLARLRKYHVFYDEDYNYNDKILRNIYVYYVPKLYHNRGKTFEFVC